MFGWGKKQLVINAPLAGTMLDITAVPDEVFSAKMLGDGFAVEPAADAVEIVAPCDCRVLLIPDTLHAVALSSHGVEMLIHIGLNTAELQGQGFEALVRAGDSVRGGTPLIRFDRQAIENKGKSLLTVLAVTNMADTVQSLAKDLSQTVGTMTLHLK